MSDRIQAPRGTYDVLGEQALARDALEEHARRILERAGYERIETPTFEATELFARGVGESTDVVQKEMYTLDSGEHESISVRIDSSRVPQSPPGRSTRPTEPWNSTSPENSTCSAGIE